MNELHLVHQLVLSLQDEVKGVREDCAGLSKRLETLTEFMVRMTTLEQDRNLPARLAEQQKRIETLEHALTTAKAFAGFASILSVILAIWMAVKQLMGG